MTITLTVAGRIASVDATAHVVAGNTYPVALSLDSEWTGSLYLRVRFGSLYYDIPFASSATSVDVQMPVGYPEVGIGVFSEALEICTNEARVRLLRSILEAGEQVVEFDSDLYDQWAGEVSELLCDDAFDATSDRPVKNSVITAWKDTVPLDANLVHKTGSETIGGVKTFTYSPTIQASNAPTLDLRTGLASDANSWKGRVVFYDKKSGADSLVGDLLSATGPTSTTMSLRASAPDRATQVAIGLRANSDGTAWADAPTYTTNNNADTKIVTRSMLAQTPTVVHTTGTETIAGVKTFSAPPTITSGSTALTINNPSSYEASGSRDVLVFNGAGTEEARIFRYAIAGRNGTYIRQNVPGGNGSGQIGIVALSNGDTYAEVPTYTADNNADLRAVNRAMLAQTPTVVHTTGAETIAGNKTFSGQVSFEKPIGQMAGFVANLTGWTRIYEVTSHHNGGNIRIHADPAVSAKKPTEAQLYVSGNAGSMSFIEIARDFDVSIVAVRRASDKHIEIWCRGAWALWSVPFLYRHDVAHGDNAYSETAPAVGSTYDMIATFN